MHMLINSFRNTESYVNGVILFQTSGIIIEHLLLLQRKQKQNYQTFKYLGHEKIRSGYFSIRTKQIIVPN